MSRTCPLAVRWLLFALLAGPAAAGIAKPLPEAPPRPLRVLFVGNSYIYTNVLPVVMAQVAETRGVLVEPGMLAEPDYAIEDHLASGAYQRVLDDGWDWVILQQGPSSLPQNREHLASWSRRAADLARAQGTQVALMSAWPALGNAHTWIDAELSYHLAAIAAEACVLPVATAWRHAYEQLPAVQLYQRDRLHPEREGTLLAALVIVRALLPQPYREGAPDMRLAIDDPEWRPALAQTEALDRIARDAIVEETQRCWRGK